MPLRDQRQARWDVAALGMIQSLISAILEMLLSAAVSAVVKFFGLENAVEIAMVVIGLGFIAIGFTAYLLGH